MKHSLIVVAAVSAIVGGGVVYSGTQPNSWFQREPAIEKKANVTGQATIAKTSYKSQDTATTAYNKVKDAVVTVQNMKRETAQPTDGFAALFGQKPKQNNPDGAVQTASEGSGVVYKIDNGYVYMITNNHVVANSDALQIITASGEKIKATIVGTDQQKDLALIKAKTDAIKTVAPFGDTKNIQSGQPVLAIGSPLGSQYATSVTSGIISAPRRDLTSQQTGGNTEQVIQTDTAINPGNSGGPLVDLNGQVIGINSSKVAASDNGTSVEGMGFAIPADVVQSFIKNTEK